jgi:hypothetical protein
MPFRKYILRDGGEPSYVFYCLWEDSARAQSSDTQFLTYDKRLSPVLAGQRNNGLRSLEIVVSGYQDINEAEKAVVSELNKIVRVSKTGGK